jgi:hypothetical protein
MGIWKDFCRTIESKVVRRHFGDLTSLVNTCAVFEFTHEQAESAEDYRPPADDEAVPPFPFPRMCCVMPTSVILLQSPSMDDAGVLRFETIAWATSREHRGATGFQTGSCTVSPNGTVVETANIRGVCLGRYHDDDHPFERIDVEDAAQRKAYQDDVIGLVKRSIAEAERAGDQRLIDERLGHLAEFEEKFAAVEAGRAELASLGEKFGDVQVDVVREAFQMGLQAVQWINKPEHYTVEIGALEAPRKAKGEPRVRRLAERPRHIVLTKSEIAEAWRRVHLGGTHASPLPHLRRGHYRTLERATPGERRVWVRPAHINGTCVEWRDGDIRYRVL